MVQRVTYRTRKSYNTKSNIVRKVKTPGGRLVLHKVGKTATAPKCGMTKKTLSGLPALRPFEYSQLRKHDRTINRAYGGSLSHKSLQERVLKAFLMEEKRCVDKIVNEKAQQAKKKKVAPTANVASKKKAAPKKKTESKK